MKEQPEMKPVKEEAQLQESKVVLKVINERDVCEETDQVMH